MTGEDSAPEVTPYQRLSHATMDLLINVGLMDSVSEHFPLEVQENWEARLQMLTNRMQEEMLEIQEFASGFDGE